MRTAILYIYIHIYLCMCNNIDSNNGMQISKKNTIRYIYIYNIAVLITICLFESTLLLKYAIHCRNWTFQRFARAAQKKGRNGIN